MILRVNRDAGDRSHHPVVLKRLRPERLDAVRRSGRTTLRGSGLLRRGQGKRAGDDDGADRAADTKNTVHTPPPRRPALPGSGSWLRKTGQYTRRPTNLRSHNSGLARLARQARLSKIHSAEAATNVDLLPALPCRAC